MVFNRMFSAIALIVFLAVIASLIPSYATDTKVSLSSKVIEVLPGDSFTIEVSVSDVNRLISWQVPVKYNGTIINCTSAWIPENNVFAGMATVFLTPILNEPTTDGYNYTLLGSSLYTESVNVPKGVLFKLNFTAQTYGLTQLQIATKEDPVLIGKRGRMQYSILLDPDLEEMPYAVENGEVRVGTLQTLTLTNSVGGTTEPPPGNYTYVYGESVSVTAVPNLHRVLDDWLLDGSNIGRANPVSVLMTQNHILQPVFTEGNFTLMISDVIGGITSLLPGTYTFPAGDTVQVMAAAGEGYRFDHWVLDNSTVLMENPVTVSMDGNHTLEATFSEVYYTSTIYIRPNGAVDPSDVPIFTLDNITYTFNGTVSDSIIVVQRSNIVIDGDGHTLQGGGSGEGFSLYGVNNVTIKNTNIRGFDRGVCLYGSSQNVISRNNITANKWLGLVLYYSCNNTIVQNNLSGNNDAGVRLEYSSNWNTIVGNNIVANKWLGIYIDSSSSNFIHHNNWVNNKNQVYIPSNGYQSANFWDDGFEGNFWNDYTGPDSDNDGIVDAALILDENNVDHYPLVGTFQAFPASAGRQVNIFSNSTVENFQYSESDRKISFSVRGANGTTGYCKIVIDRSLMDVDRLRILIDDGNTEVLTPNYNLRDNTTHRWICFSYEQSTHLVVIQEDVTPPTIIVTSPQNRTYSANSVSLVFTVDEPTSWNGYSLDDADNVTVNGNVTLTSLLDGHHSLVVYSNDTVGNMGSSVNVLFTVDTTPPNIIEVTQAPGVIVTFEDTVAVNATVADDVGIVENVTLTYSCVNSSSVWNGTVEMTNPEGSVWSGVIPAFPYGTNVTYTVEAVDSAGNTVNSEEMGFEFQYQVVPEFPLLTVLFLFVLSSLLTALASRRRRYAPSVQP
jgi:parallel beta-helix repeat protein